MADGAGIPSRANSAPTPEEFHRAMIDLYKRAKIEAQYEAKIFLGMISERGGLETARYLLQTAEPSEGYVALWERRRLDLTVEAAVLKPEWSPLFSDDERSTARARLQAYGYEPR